MNDHLILTVIDGMGWFWQMEGEGKVWFSSIYYESRMEALQKLAENDITWSTNEYEQAEDFNHSHI